MSLVDLEQLENNIRSRIKEDNEDIRDLPDEEKGESDVEASEESIRAAIKFLKLLYDHVPSAYTDTGGVGFVWQRTDEVNSLGRIAVRLMPDGKLGHLFWISLKDFSESSALYLNKQI